MVLPLRLAVLLLVLAACKSRDAGDLQPVQGVSGATAGLPTPVGASGATAAAAVSGARASAPLAGSTAESGGAATDAQASGGAGAPASIRPVDAGAADSGQMPMAGAPAAPSDAGPAANLDSYAKDLNGLFIDAPCDPSTPLQLASMATCLHAKDTQRIERKITFGGTPGSMYSVKLRVRGIWEPTKIQDGERPLGKNVPFTVGGMLPPGTGSSDPISYQQYSIQVSEPKQTYWLNDHQYLAHDIHKEDYQPTLQIGGGSTVSVIMNDGNDHEIANWTKDFFEGVPPYDTKPSLGQSLRLDVVSVTAL
jgi:hypothetical protein